MKRKFLKTKTKNIRIEDFIYEEEKFEEITKLEHALYWPPLKLNAINSIREQLNSAKHSSELWFEKALKENKIRGYLKNWSVLNRFFADFYFPRIKTIIEVDGKEHKRETDIRRDRLMRLAGIKTLRINAYDGYRLDELIEYLVKIPRAKDRFKLMAKKVNEALMWKYFPPEIKPNYVNPNETHNKEKSNVVIIRREGVERTKYII